MKHHFFSALQMSILFVRNGQHTVVVRQKGEGGSGINETSELRGNIVLTLVGQTDH